MSVPHGLGLTARVGQGSSMKPGGGVQKFGRLSLFETPAQHRPPRIVRVEAVRGRSNKRQGMRG
jgi:hypothetical protein